MSFDNLSHLTAVTSRNKPKFNLCYLPTQNASWKNHSYGNQIFEQIKGILFDTGKYSSLTAIKALCERFVFSSCGQLRGSKNSDAFLKRNFV